MQSLSPHSHTCFVTDLQGNLKVDKARREAPGKVVDIYEFGVDNGDDCVEVMKRGGWHVARGDVCMVEEWAKGQGISYSMQ